MAGSDGERGSAPKSMLPGEAELQSAPTACPSSTLYSVEYDAQKIENADVAVKPDVKERMRTGLMAADRMSLDPAGIDGGDG